MKTRNAVLLISAVAVLLVVQLPSAQSSRATVDSQHPSTHVIVTPQSKNFEPSGPGAGFTVLSGSPTLAGTAFVIRLKFADGTQIPPHWHPIDEHITVVSGTFHIGMGDKFDESKTETMPPGSYSLMPAGMRHYAWTKGETVIQIHGIGPFKTYWVSSPPSN